MQETTLFRHSISVGKIGARLGNTFLFVEEVDAAFHLGLDM